MNRVKSFVAIATAYDRPYETLGVPRVAPADEICAAYYWLARRHSPEADPREFALISAAFRVLAEPGSRRRIDARPRATDDEQSALDAAWRCIANAPGRAAQLAAELSEDEDRPRHVRVAAASICVAAGSPEPAIAYLADVVAESPGDVEAICRRAEAYVARERLETAVDLLQEAIARHPREPELQVCLARVHHAAGDMESEAAALRAAVNVLGGSRAHSAPVQFMRLEVLATAGLFVRMHGVAQELRKGAEGGDEEFGRHVVSRYTNWAAAAMEERSYELAGFLLESAYEIAPTDELQRKRDEVAPLAVSQLEAFAALPRAEVAGWVKSLLRAMLAGSIEEGQRHALITAARNTYALAPLSANVQWKRFEKDFPAAARFIATYVEQIRADVESSSADAEHRPATTGAAPARARAAESPRCVAPHAPATPHPRPASSRSTVPGRKTRAGTRASVRSKGTAGASVAAIIGFALFSFFGRACARAALRDSREPKPSVQEQLQDRLPHVSHPVDPSVLEEVERLNRMTPEERDASMDAIYGNGESR